MYKVDPILLEKFQSMQQTRANNNDPNPLAYITRNRTPITTQRFWEKLRVTSTVGTRSSIAVRRPEGNLTGDVIFVAQVEDGNAVIRKAEPRINLTDMGWSHVTTIDNVSELSIMFDGYMKMVEGKVESYTTGELPVVFYVDSDNSLKGWNMNNDIQFTISDTAYNVASVRGLYSEAADLNDGIFVFYTNAEGELWEARVLNDEVTELTQITLKPDGVTGWEDVWASLTFDYRVVLQLKGDDGNIYSLLSASRPSGFSLFEHLEYKTKVVQGMTGRCGTLPPNVTHIYNTAENPQIITIEFDGEPFVFNRLTGIWVEGEGGEKRHPISITKINNNKVNLIFNNLVGLPGKPHYLMNNNDVVCIGSDDGTMSSTFGQSVFLWNIDFRHTGFEYLEYKTAISQEFSGLHVETTYPKMYSDNEYLEYKTVISQAFTGTQIETVYAKGYTGNEYLEYKTTVNQDFSGGVFDINGIPV